MLPEAESRSSTRSRPFPTFYATSRPHVLTLDSLLCSLHKITLKNENPGDKAHLLRNDTLSMYLVPGTAQD